MLNVNSTHMPTVDCAAPEQAAVASTHLCSELRSTNTCRKLLSTDGSESWDAARHIYSARHNGYEPLSALARERTPSAKDVMYDNPSRHPGEDPRPLSKTIKIQTPWSPWRGLRPFETSELVECSGLAASMLQELPQKAGQYQKQQQCFADDKLPRRSKIRNLSLRQLDLLRELEKDPYCS